MKLEACILDGLRFSESDGEEVTGETASEADCKTACDGCLAYSWSEDQKKCYTYTTIKSPIKSSSYKTHFNYCGK